MTVELAPLAPEEAIAYFTRRGLKLEASFDWRDMWQDCHATAFTVAKSTGFDILGDVRDACSDVLAKGRTFRDFAQELTPRLAAKGWWGRKTMVDPLTGEERTVQLGSARRLRTIYDVNLRTAQAAGAWEQIQRVKEARPWLRYVAIDDSRTRQQHRSWHNTVLRADDPWWRTHYPPNGWKCRCTVQQLSGSDLAEFGLAPSTAPVIEMRPWINKRTGQTVFVPDGIDPGFGYNVGIAGMRQNAARVAMEKLIGLPPGVGATAMTELGFALPQAEKELEAWIESIATKVNAGDFRPTGTRRVVGAFSDRVLAFLGARGIEPASGAITVSDNDIIHALRSAKVAPLPASVWQRLPSLLAAPEAIYWDKQDPGLVYVLDEKEGRGKIIVLVDYTTKVDRKMVRTNVVRTGRKIDNFEEFDNPGRYSRIW